MNFDSEISRVDCSLDETFCLQILRCKTHLLRFFALKVKKAAGKSNSDVEK